jgi:hypothetical protein
MSGVLDLFLAQPFGARSLLQRIFSMAIHDGIKTFQKSISSLSVKIGDDTLVDKLRAFTEASEDVKNEIRQEAKEDDVDIIVVILRSELFGTELTTSQIEKVFNSYVAWVSTVENVSLRFSSISNRSSLFPRVRQSTVFFADTCGIRLMSPCRRVHSGSPI